MRTWVPLFAFLLVGPTVFAQENCSNAIDDDGDGLVDLNDTDDCNCTLSAQTPSLLPNPSLELFDPFQSGCASVQPGGLPDGTNQANCLTGWERASLGTTDAWNAFTFVGAGPYFPNTLPQPLPSGSGVAGFWVGIHDEPGHTFINGDGTTTTQYREYLAACFTDDQRLHRGTTYRLDFALGFLQSQTTQEVAGELEVRSPETVELAVYGIRHCEQLNFGAYYSCPEAAGAAGYELITTVTVTGRAGGWTPTTLEFVATTEYEALAIGGSCAPDNDRPDGGLYRNYYFIDELILNETTAFAAPTAGSVRVDGLTVCDDITLTGTPTPGASYQWYRNGVALRGATSYVLALAGGTASIDGDYVLRVATPAGCATTDPVHIQRPIITDQIPDTLGLCVGQDSLMVRPRRPGGATFRWSDGSVGNQLSVTTPGTYRVTVTEACVEHTESFVVAENPALAYTFEQLSPGCGADSVTLQLTTNSHNPRLNFRALPGEARLRHTDGRLHLATAGIEGVMVFVDNGCSLVLDTLWIDRSGRSFNVGTPAIEHLSCTLATASITARLADVPPGTTYRWFDASGTPLGATTRQLSVRQSGTYTLELTAPGYCTERRTYTVHEETPFSATFAVRPEQCVGGGGSISLTGITLASDYQIRWFQDDWVLAAYHDRPSITDLDHGTYHVEITSASGCTYRESFTIAGPSVLTAQAAAAAFTVCDDPHSGQVTLTARGGAGAGYRYRYGAAGEPQRSPVFTGLSSGAHTFYVTDTAGCAATPVTVQLHDPSAISIDLVTEQTSVDARFTTQLQLRTGAAPDERGTVSWYPTEGLSCSTCFSPAASPRRTTDYTATYVTPQGCVATASITVSVNDDPQVYVPNVFRPGGMENEHFTIYPGTRGVTVIDLRIYDRWGELLYVQKSSEQAGWDGTFRGKPVQQGTFVYVAEVLLTNGTTWPMAGSVTLLR